MIPYKNLKGDSGVLAYNIAPTSITVKFTDGNIYLYTYASAGIDAVEDMKKLAANGRGLATYISKYVKASYERKVA